MTIVDNYFPFDTGPGATATAARWRLMARLWSSTGVIPLFLNSLVPSIAGSVVTIQPGAVWIDGYYGESDSAKTVGVSGNGMVVARMDPTARQILFAFVPNQTVPTQNPNGIYEVPIMQVTGATGTDIRLFAIEAASAVPPGVMFDYGGGTAPLGWLLCNGLAVSRTQYAALFSAIGTSWGAGNGSTTFNLPDFRGRTTMGSGTVGTNGQPSLVLGAYGGEQNHVLSIAELASHAHANNTGAMSANSQHNHGFNSGGIQVAIGLVGAGPYGVPNTGPNWVTFTSPTINPTNTDHTHAIPAQGGNSGHNNMPPYGVVLKMIKT